MNSVAFPKDMILVVLDVSIEFLGEQRRSLIESGGGGQGSFIWGAAFDDL